MGRTLIKTIWRNDGRQDGEKGGQDSKVDGRKTEPNRCRLKANSFHLNRLKMELSCPAWCFNRNLGVFASVVYSLWRIPCFSSWVQAPQHTKAAPPSNWEKLDGPVPFSMISFPICKGSKTPRNTTGNWREAGRRRNYREQQRPPSIPERQKRKREYKVPGCDQALLNSSTR